MHVSVCVYVCVSMCVCAYERGVMYLLFFRFQCERASVCLCVNVQSLSQCMYVCGKACVYAFYAFYAFCAWSVRGMRLDAPSWHNSRLSVWSSLFSFCAKNLQQSRDQLPWSFFVHCSGWPRFSLQEYFLVIALGLSASDILLII
jgi:hypothetical protein